MEKRTHIDEVKLLPCDSLSRFLDIETDRLCTVAFDAQFVEAFVEQLDGLIADVDAEDGLDVRLDLLSNET
jgi:hypothetical protein